MKKIASVICGLLALSMLASCSSDKPEKDKSTTTENTTAPHAHFDPDTKYPDTIDFSDTEGLIELFDMCEILDGVEVEVISKSQSIKLSATVNDVDFKFIVNLAGAAGKTTPKQIVTCAKLFWYCYPQMYARFACERTPKTVTLKFEDFGYEVASASGNEVHIHDEWLKNNPTDFDCLTHEFSHIIQSGWDGGYVPSHGADTYMIERFADYCRYLYSFQSGRYNDSTWTLQDIKSESEYYTSVRFWVWLDYTYSTPEIDIMNLMHQQIVKEERACTSLHWKPEGEAWQKIFKGTGAEGKTIPELWEEYAATDFSTLSSNSRRPGSKSPLLAAYPLRDAIRNRYPASDDYITWKE